MLYVGKCDLIMSGEIFEYPEYKLDRVFKDAIFFHIRGLVNSKGLNYLQKRLKTPKMKYFFFSIFFRFRFYTRRKIL